MRDLHKDCDEEAEMLQRQIDSLKLALNDALETIHLEFCGSGQHHPNCIRPREIAGKYTLPSEADWMRATE